MTREEIALMIHWDAFFWFVGFVNVGAMLPQAWTLMKTKKTEGLDPRMVWIYLFVQVSFAIQGFFRRDAVLMYCLGASACVSVAVLVLYYRYRSCEGGYRATAAGLEDPRSFV